jgi:hypothetical protein
MSGLFQNNLQVRKYLVCINSYEHILQEVDLDL